MSTYAVPPTRREAVVRQLRDEIVSGVLPPGTLIKDAELAARLGVSITPVREAIAQLSVEGLIDIAPNRARHVTKVTNENALELIDVMAIVTCAAFEQALPNLTDDDLKAMQEHLTAFSTGVRGGQVLAGLTAAAEFNSVITAACGNRELQSMIDLLVAREMRVSAISREGVWDIWIDGYTELLDLLARGDQAAALERYRQIYVDYRAQAETILFPDTVA